MHMASMPGIEATPAQTATLGLGMHHLANALHINRDHLADREAIGGVILVETSPHGSFDGTSPQHVVASNVFTPDAPGALALMSDEFVSNCIERSQTLVAMIQKRADIYGVWLATDARGEHSSAVMYVGNGHHASITWGKDGRRSTAIGSMILPPSPVLQRIAIPSVEMTDMTNEMDMSDAQRLAVLYRAIDKRLRAH